MKRVLMALLVVLTATACRSNDIAFRRNEVLAVTSPPADAVVTLPLDVSWVRTDGSDATLDTDGSDGYYLVLVDRAPMGPGRSLLTLVDDQCLDIEGCPDQDWLVARHMYPLTDGSITLSSLPRDSGAALDGLRRHEIVIVRMTRDNHRIGDEVYDLAFYTREETES